MQEERLKQLQAELKSFEQSKTDSIKAMEFLKLQIKAEDQKIKATQTLIDAINANTKQEKGQPANP
jgi:hypothetical protein